MSRKRKEEIINPGTREDFFVTRSQGEEEGEGNDSDRMPVLILA